MSDETYRLYRYFDSRRRLLYVGISGDLARRNSSHISRSKWMQFTAASRVEPYATLEDLKAAERVAIEAEHPIFNKLHNSTPEAWKRMRTYLGKVGRLDLMPPEREVSRKPRVAYGNTRVYLLGVGDDPPRHDGWGGNSWPRIGLGA